ncbi:MAG: formylglycine-generating enzyme family protein [Treponema sp.]|nr:formylglycine-generating enzyme family protein [Treponema sp.]
MKNAQTTCPAAAKKGPRVFRNIAPALAALSLAVGLLAGCRDALQPQNVPDPVPESPAETGRVSLTIGRGIARAFLADIQIDGFDDLVFFLYFSPGSGNPNMPFNVHIYGGTFEGDLASGIWNLYITAFSPAGGDAVAWYVAPAPFTVSPGQTTHVVVGYLAPVPSGPGLFSWSLAFYLGGDASMALRNLDGDIISDDLLYLGFSESIPLPAGQYRAYLTLRHGGDQVTISRIVNIYAGMTSRWIQTFTPGHLNRSFLDHFLESWDGSSWDLSWAQPGHFNILRAEEGIEGVYPWNFGEVVEWFNGIHRLPGHPGYGTADCLRALVDAALVETGARALFAAPVNLSGDQVEEAIRGYARNGTGITFHWPDWNLVVATIGDRYSVEIYVQFPAPRDNHLIHIQGGTFQMGYCPSGEGLWCGSPTRAVTVSGFYMRRFQVTQGEWYDVMGTRPSSFTGETNWDGVPVTGVNWRNLPVEIVSWYDALVFSNRLSIMHGLTPAYSIGGSTNPNDWGSVPTTLWDAVGIVPGSTGYRLPTEAQWEFAARGGIVCMGNFVYSGSDTVADVAWIWENSEGRTHEVGTRQPNALGLYDMSGNVWEWIWDWFGTYPSIAETDPVGASSGSERVLRGGSWGSLDRGARSAYRHGADPAYRNSFLGFRLVRPSIPVDDFVRVHGGTFQMGYCPSGQHETPIRAVTVSGFYISRFQVTQGEWYDVMGTRPSWFTGETNLDGVPVTGVNWRNLPVERVSWYDALVFSNRLSIQRGLEPAYRISGSTNPGDWGTPTASWDAVEIVPGSTGYRLPTEAQWEFAARGGIVCQGNFVFSGSDTVADVAWIPENSGRRTHEVGTRQPNALGLYDMSGNIFEWVWDWLGTYPDIAETDPTGAVYGYYRVHRGGCWYVSSVYARSALRLGFHPDDRSSNLGFRLVRP